MTMTITHSNNNAFREREKTISFARMELSNDVTLLVIQLFIEVQLRNHSAKGGEKDVLFKLGDEIWTGIEINEFYISATWLEELGEV